MIMEVNYTKFFETLSYQRHLNILYLSLSDFYSTVFLFYICGIPICELWNFDLHVHECNAQYNVLTILYNII